MSIEHCGAVRIEQPESEVEAEEVMEEIAEGKVQPKNDETSDTVEVVTEVNNPTTIQINQVSSEENGKSGDDDTTPKFVIQ